MSMTQLLLVLEELVSEPPSVSQKLDSEPLVSQNCSQQGPTLLLLKEVLMLHLVICTMMTGDGISMILSKVVIGSETKTLSII